MVAAVKVRRKNRSVQIITNKNSLHFIFNKIGTYPNLNSEGCSIKQVFFEDLIKIFVKNLIFLMKFNKDFIKVLKRLYSELRSLKNI